MEIKKLGKAALRKANQVLIDKKIQELKDISKHIHIYKKITPPLAIDKGETLCILLSDWHFGKINTDQKGKITFNSKIAKSRLLDILIPNIFSFITKTGKSKWIKDVRIIFLGDLIDNEIIYPHHEIEVEDQVSDQFNKCLKAIMEMLSAILYGFKLIGMPNVPIGIDGITGNHGRSSGHEEHGARSWDTAIYMGIKTALAFAKIKNIHVDYSFGHSKIITVRGQRGLMKHWAPSQAESAGSRAKFGGWNEIYKYDFLCYGHWHHWGVNTYHGKPLFRNGSLCGTDDYAMKLGVSDQWSQLIWGVAKNNPCTFVQRIGGFEKL